MTNSIKEIKELNRRERNAALIELLVFVVCWLYALVIITLLVAGYL